MPIYLFPTLCAINRQEPKTNHSISVSLRQNARSEDTQTIMRQNNRRRRDAAEPQPTVN